MGEFKAVTEAILLSGGIAITIDYGQSCAEAEMRASRQICKELNMKHEEIRVDCGSLGSGDLAGLPASSVAPVPEWWPFRNQLLITLAAMRAIELDVATLIVGAVRTDASHVDGTSKFFKRIDDLMCMQEGNIRICTPAIKLSSSELVRASGIDLSILAWAHSCHRSNFACGNCRGCYKHRSVMVELGYEAY
jgi:7-cyano-7-deazaguanine synthase